MQIDVLGLTKSGTTVPAYPVYEALPGRSKRIFIEPGETRGVPRTRPAMPGCAPPMAGSPPKTSSVPTMAPGGIECWTSSGATTAGYGSRGIPATSSSE